MKNNLSLSTKKTIAFTLFLMAGMVFAEEGIFNLSFSRKSEFPRQNIDAQDPVTGSTVLHDAVKASNYNLVKKLLMDRACPDIQDACGATPAHYAAYNNDLVMIKLLRDAGDSLGTPDMNGKTPGDIAAQVGHMYLAELCLNYACKGRQDVSEDGNKLAEKYSEVARALDQRHHR